MKKLAFAALIALSLAGVVSTPAMAAPCPPNGCHEPPTALQEDAYKRGSFDITLQGDPSQWGAALAAGEDGAPEATSNPV